MTTYQNEIVDRSAPRWAWDIIDETLAIDARSIAFDRELKQEIGAAMDAIITASEHPELTQLAPDQAKG